MNILVNAANTFALWVECAVPGRSRGLNRRMLARLLSGGVVVVAALTLPELSVGAGDVRTRERFADRYDPVPAKQPWTRQRRLDQNTPALTGVHHASMPDLVPAAAAISTPLIDGPAAATISGADAPMHAAFDQSLPMSGAEPAPALLPTPALPVARVAANPEPMTEPAAFALAPIEADIPSLQIRASGLAAVTALDTLQPALPSAPAAPEPSVAATPASMRSRARETNARGIPLAALAPSSAMRDPSAAIVPHAAPIPVFGRDLQSDTTVPAEALPEAPANASLAAPQSDAAAFKQLQGLGAAEQLSPSLFDQPDKPAEAKMAAAPETAALAPVTPRPALTAPGSFIASPDPFDVKSQLITRVDGMTAGVVDFRQTATGLEVRLGSIVEVLADRYDASALTRIRTSEASNTYMPLTELQAQGIPISYDPVYDEFNVGVTDTRPAHAVKVHMDQISAPERGLGATAMDQMER